MSKIQKWPSEDQATQEVTIQTNSKVEFVNLIMEKNLILSFVEPIFAKNIEFIRNNCIEIWIENLNEFWSIFIETEKMWQVFIWFNSFTLFESVEETYWKITKIIF